MSQSTLREPVALFDVSTCDSVRLVKDSTKQVTHRCTAVEDD